MKRVLISFSGGLDSTYLVYDNLKNGNIVTGVYTTIENNVNKTRVELNQIKKLEKLFLEEFPNNFNLEIGMKINAQSGNDVTMKQISIWIISLLYSRSSTYDEVQIGAVMNDDMISFLDDIKNLWDAFSFVVPKKTPLIFPLMKKSKCEISNLLPQKYKDLVVFCEDPKIINDIPLLFENCNNCHSCKRYKYESDLWGLTYGQIQQNISDSDPAAYPTYPTIKIMGSDVDLEPAENVNIH